MTSPKPSLIEIAPDAKRPISLSNHIYATLKQRILSCHLKPNERLVEKELCDDLSVSRTPLREALNRLSNEDLVLFQPNCGYTVTPITIEGFKKLNEVRRIVEPQIASIAANRATQEEIDQLRSYATSTEYIPGDENSFVRYCRTNSHFHLCLVRCTKNHLLENIAMSALDRSQQPTYLGIGRQLDAGNPSAEHHAIVDALEERDALKAQSIMYHHIFTGEQRVIKALREAGYT